MQQLTKPRLFCCIKRFLTVAAVILAFQAVLTRGGLPNPVVPITWNGAASGLPNGNWDILNTANWVTTSGGAPYEYQDTSAVTFDDSLAGTTNVILTTTLSPGSITVNNTLSNYVFSGSGKISGTTGLTKTGSGTLVVDNSGSNAFSGSVTISAGTIQIGNGDASGNLPGAVIDNGSLIFNRGDTSLTHAGVISGTGTVFNNGSGTVTLSVANTFTGGLTLNNGTLMVNSTGNGSTSLGGVANNTSSTAAANVTVNAGATLVGLGADAFGYYPHTAPGTIFINGGTVTDVGTSSYRITLPNLTFTGGTLASAAGNAGDANGNYSLYGTGAPCTITTLSNNTTAVISAGIITLQQNNQPTGTTAFNVAAGNVTGGMTPGVDLLVSSVIANFGAEVGSVLKTGSGVMALDSTNLYTGTTTVSGGTLQLGTTNDTAVLAEPVGTGAVTNNAILNFASGQGVAVHNIISGTGAVVVSSGTNILTATNTYAGNTMVKAGILLLTGSSSIANSPTITLASGATFDVSQLASPFTVGAGQTLGGSGIISGNVIVNGKLQTGVTNTINGNLTYNTGTEADFNLNTSATGGGNDQTVLNGAGSILSCGGASIGINCGAILDQANDYTLFNLTGGSASIVSNFNVMPVWTGTTPANASSYGIVILRNKVLLHFNSTGTTNLPVVTNLPASNIAATTATLNGQVLSTGGQYPAVNIYYGTTDGGTNPAAWATNVSLGLQTGSFAAAAFNLTTNTTYYFTTSASNSAGMAWATPSQSFTTTVASVAVATNLPASNVQGSSAILNGQILSIGSQVPTVTLYYGPTDGGTNASNWANNVYLGQQGGNFIVTVTGLSTNTTYYYAAAATNIAGTAWASPSANFTTLPTALVVSVLTYHYDNARTGANTNETLLTPSIVNTNSFGLLIKYVVDGFVVAQPLYVPSVAIPGQGTHNVVFVATENASIYAFDADGNTAVNGGLLWHTNLGIVPLLSNGEFGYRYGIGNGLNIGYYEQGITDTPVIDPVSGTIYVDVLTREVTTTTNYYHRIHALSITNGMEQSYSPVVVTASVPGTGMDSSNGVVTFNAKQQNQRPGLTLAGGILYVAYGSFNDTDPFHGWVMGFNATNLVQLTNCIFNTTPNATTNVFGPNAGEGALWMGGDGLCVDANNNLFFQTGNGSFSANTNGGDYADSMIKLSTSNSLAVADYFTPYNQLTLANFDIDLGSCGAVLLPDSVGSTNHPHLIVSTGKSGTIYLVDRDNMGHYHGTDGINGNDSQIVQSVIGATASTWSSPAYFNNQIYLQPSSAAMKAFIITNGVIVPSITSVAAAGVGLVNGGPIISANGASNGIVWVLNNNSGGGTETLYACTANNIAQQLYNSSQLSRDNPGFGIKMTTPMVANGKVYVGAQYALSVYGLTTFVATPTISPNGIAFTNSVTVTLSDATAGTAIYYTLNGTIPTTNSLLYTGPFAITTTLNLQAIAVKSGAVNSGVASASFVNTAALGSGIGLLGQYWTNTSALAFTNISFNTAATLTRTDAVVNYNWSTNGPDPSIGQTNFIASWTGSVQPQYSETYTFTTVADDGVRLWVNGQLLIDDWNTHSSTTTNSGSISLNAQELYNIQMDYFQGGSNAVAQLMWSSLSAAQNIIPQTQLYPYTNSPPAVVLSSPANNSSYTATASVTIGANADAAYNPISAVSFYANGVLLGTVSNSPYAPLYELTATGLGAGSYALTAVATDGSGLCSTSASVNITVNAGSGAPYGLTNTVPVSAFLNMPTTFNGALPALLSGTGAFSDTTNRIPAGGLIPYQPNTPLWSDGAVKSRYMVVPNPAPSGSGTITPDQQIAFAPTNNWTFPAGTVFVKNFDLVVDQTSTNTPLRRLETRLLVRNINGAVYGVTYKWRPDNSDADLLSSSLTENILITNATGVSTQAWYYPSPADCLTCHTPVANYVLGVNTRQLNGSLTYPATGVTDNQLRTLNHLGLFNPAFDESTITNFESLSALTNLTASLEERARSYLDANCAQCHQPGGSGITFDARYDTPLSRQNITNYPAAFSLGVDSACIIKADDVWRSVLLARINTNAAAIKMPPLARSIIDTNAVQVIAGWINSLSGMPTLAPPVITPNGGSYYASVGVTLTPPDTNAAIYYTLDGSLPTTGSLQYSGAFNLTGNATVTASAFETNFNNSIGAGAQFLVQPLNFTSLGYNTAGGQFQMGFEGVMGETYVLQATTNFTDWTPISTNNATTNFLNLTDPDSTNFQNRFYRVLLIQ